MAVITGIKPFDTPVYVTRPVLPDLSLVQNKLAQIWASGLLTNGADQHTALQGALTRYLNVPGLTLFNNGTIGLLVALKALGLTKGEVITTPFTFPATPHSISWNGLTPVFADIDPNTLTLSPEAVEAAITPDTVAILGVHVYGVPCHVHALQAIARRHGLALIYDAAHAFGTTVEGKGIGQFGDAAMFSFHATKLFHTVEGGAVSFNNPDLAQRMNLLKNFGIHNAETVSDIGINGKMNELQAAIGLLVLDELHAERRRRRDLLAVYQQSLAEVPGIQFVLPPASSRLSYQYTVIRVDAKAYGLDRDTLCDRLAAMNIFPRKYFYPLCSDYDCYRHLPSSQHLPVAQQAVTEVLALPFYGALTNDEANRIALAIAWVQQNY